MTIMMFSIVIILITIAIKIVIIIVCSYDYTAIIITIQKQLTEGSGSRPEMLRFKDSPPLGEGSEGSCLLFFTC